MTYIYTEYDYLAHHGIKGMKWGVRRFQNEDGSLKPAGEKRYSGNSRSGGRGSPTAKVKRRKLTEGQKRALKIAGATAATAALAYAGYKGYGKVMANSKKYTESARELAAKYANESNKSLSEGIAAKGRLKNLEDSLARAASEADRYRYKDDDISKKLYKRARDRYEDIQRTQDREGLSLIRKAATGERYSKAQRELSNYYANNADNTLYAWKERGYRTRKKRRDGSAYYSRLPSLKKQKAPTGNNMKMLRRI